MPIEILMPALSPTMKEGNLAKWLKKEGDKIKPGDVIAEIETDKATMEVEAVDEGIIAKILVASGAQNIPVNSLIALLLEEGESEDLLLNYQPKTAVNIKVTDNVDTNKTTSILPQITPISEVNKDSTRIKASPLAKRIAAEKKIDLALVSGTGPYGRIIKEDILNFNNTCGRSDIVSRNAQEYKVIPNNNIRKVIAKRLQESKQNIPHFYLSVECNIDKLLNLREEINADQLDNKISINDLIIKAVAMALFEVPEANASWTEEAILQYNNVDISVAVAIDGGLITPIVKNANQKSIMAISKEMKTLAKKAKDNLLKPEEFQGGGFSISNLGMYGIKNFQAIVNPPQVCIMAVGASSKRAVVINDQLSIATIIDISLSCDHRVVDGAVGAKFLQSFKKYIEHPIKMII